MAESYEIYFKLVFVKVMYLKSIIKLNNCLVGET